MKLHFRTMIAAMLCSIGANQVAHADSDFPDFAFVADNELGLILMLGDLIFIQDVQPIIDEQGETGFDVDFVIIPADEEPIIICITSQFEPDPGDLLTIDGFNAPETVPGGDPNVGGTAVFANKTSLIEISRRVKLKHNQKLKVVFFGSAVIDPAELFQSTLRLGDPTLESFGGTFVAPDKVVYPDLDDDGIGDALLTFDVDEMVSSGAIDSSSTFLELRFDFHGITLSTRDAIEIRN